MAALAALLVWAWPAPAQASEAFSDLDPAFVSLKVNRKGEALVVYRRADGVVRRVLVWGALDALAPAPGVRQVRFAYDYAGGWGKYGRAGYWRTFRDACGPYTGPRLRYLVAACTAPDGTHWALQRWQRGLPLLGFEAFRPEHTAWELHVSHFSGDLARLEVFPNWTYRGAWQGIFGRLTYRGTPVHGLAATKSGNPKDRFGRNVYIDTLDSAYGRGWRRESGILVHSGTGTFCHSFVPQRPSSSYPSQRLRPAGDGRRHRVTVMGPGVTPVVVTELAGLTEADRGRDAELNRLFDDVMAGDRICAGER